METMSEAIARLGAAGYSSSYVAVDELLRCRDCQRVFDPASLTSDEVVRFEGVSDPADSAVLFALRSADGHRGLYAVAYGPDTDPMDAVVVQALAPTSPTVRATSLPGSAPGTRRHNMEKP